MKRTGRLLKMNPFVDIHPKVMHALEYNMPVVALESTIITHGMPFPQNLETAKKVQNIIESTNALPATIAIIEGRIKIGTTDSQLEWLAESKDIVKTSRRDISSVISSGRSGGTTVSSTMIFAHMAGIPIFVTGGIGGVHRNAEISMDISADLLELGKTPVAVICSGAKSILDTAKTLEYLETQGVPVTTIAETNAFPNFYTADSGFKSPHHVKLPIDAARMILTNQQLELNSGMVFAVPIPSQYANDGKLIQDAVETAIEESVREKVSGKETTPFLLRRVAELTKGASLKSNIRLIENNALVGAQIAVHLSNFQNEKFEPKKIFNGVDGVDINSLKPYRPIFIGGSTIDMITKLLPSTLEIDNIDSISQIPSTWKNFLHTSSPSIISNSFGGVSRNAAEACHRIMFNHLKLDKNLPILVSPVGNDSFGNNLIEGLNDIGMNMSFVKMNENSADIKTPVYNAILDSDGKLIVAGADMSLLTNPEIQISMINKVKELQMKNNFTTAVIDANLTPRTIREIISDLTFNSNKSIPIIFEPTSVSKASLVFDELIANRTKNEIMPLGLFAVSPNVEELFEISKLIEKSNIASSFQFNLNVQCRVHTDKRETTRIDAGYFEQRNNDSKSFFPLKEYFEPLNNVLSVVPNVFLKMGSRGVLLAQRKFDMNELVNDIIMNEDLDEKKMEKIDGSYVQSILNSPETWSWSLPFSGSKHGPDDVFLTYFPALEVKNIVNVTGAGDSCVGGIIAQICKDITDQTEKKLQRYDSGFMKPNVWNQISMLSRCLYLYNNLGSIEFDESVIRGRRAAESSLKSNNAVNIE